MVHAGAFAEAGLAAGQPLLITDSSGGVGSLAVELAKARGAHVTAVGSAETAAAVAPLSVFRGLPMTAHADGR